jgi:hypothetical protein
MPDSALKSRSHEWNFGGSRTCGAQVFPAPKKKKIGASFGARHSPPKTRSVLYYQIGLLGANVSSCSVAKRLVFGEGREELTTKAATCC